MQISLVVLLKPWTRAHVAEAEREIAPYLHEDSCFPRRQILDSAEDEDGPEDEGCRNNHYWYYMRVSDLGPYLWFDRYGKVPSDRQFKYPADEARRAGDVVVRNSSVLPSAVFVPHCEIFWLAKDPLDDIPLRRVGEYEDLLQDYADHIAMPMLVRR